MSRYSRIAPFVALFAVAISYAPVRAQDDAKALIAAMHPRNGAVQIANGLVQLNVGPEFRYLDSTDAVTMLTKVYHNPPDAVAGTLGMIFPKKEGENWFAVLSYSADGHVADSDASNVNYDDLMKQMQEQTEKDASERRDKGFSGLKLVGWAQRPYYDLAAKKIYWAKSIQFDQAPNATLNYDVRILGRSGYLNINIVDDIAELPKINSEMPTILSMANFTPSNRYEDYVAGSDHLAAYGIAGLVAGGVLAKAGFFKGLLVLAVAFWKVIGVAVVGFFAAIGGFFKRLIRRKSPQ